MNNIYIFKEGYLRLSSEIYSLENIDDIYIHLTNNAIQQNSSKYKKDDNIISYCQFEEYLEKKGLKGFRENGLNEIKKIVLSCFRSVQKQNIGLNRQHVFQLFGFDFIMDMDQNVYLIECNNNPCIEESNQFLTMFLERMVDDMFRITIDQVFPCSYDQDNPVLQKSSEYYIYPFEGHCNQTNMWEHLTSFNQIRSTKSRSRLLNI